MKKIFKVLILLMILPFTTITIKNVVSPDITGYEYKSKKLYVLMKEDYEWLTPFVYHTVANNLTYYALEDVERLHLLKTIIVLIDAESSGNTFATGRLCTVTIYRFGKLVTEKHRARGIMQLMIYNTPLKNSEEYLLYNPSINLYYGIKAFMAGYYLVDKNMVYTLKTYNSGYNSDHFNWKYINKILTKSKKYSI